MPTYEFVCKACGGLTEEMHPMRAIPDAALCAACGGQALRIQSVPTIADAKIRFSQKYPYASDRLSRKLPGCERDKLGRTVVKSAQHEREICAEHGYVRD